MCAEIVEILSEFHEATELMSAEKYPTLSFVFPLFSHLHSSVEKKGYSTKCPEAMEMCLALAKDLKERWLTLIEPEHLISCYLDPRFKALNFIDDRHLKRSIKAAVREKLEMVRFHEVKAPFQVSGARQEVIST